MKPIESETTANGEFYNSPEKCVQWLAEYFIAENHDDYLAQQKWCLLLLESAIYIMKSSEIAKTIACGKEYGIGELTDMAKYTAERIRSHE